MLTFKDYERTRRRQAIAILWIVAMPMLLLTAFIVWSSGSLRSLFLTGPMCFGAFYGAWDLSRVVVNPATMHVETIRPAERRRVFVRSASIAGGLSAALGAFAWWIGSTDLVWLIPAVIIGLAVQAVHLAITDTRLAAGAATGDDAARPVAIPASDALD